MVFQRARHANQVAERRVAILERARELCAEFGVMGWSLNELGRRADVTKSNLYRYFGSREEVLLVLMHEETRLFAQQFKLAINGRRMSVPELSALMVERYAEQSLLCDLLSVSAAVLEHNIEPEVTRDIKMSGIADAALVATAIMEALPEMTMEQASQIAFASGIIVTGLWPMARPSAPVQKLSEFEGLEYLRMDFRVELQRILEAQIFGVLSKSANTI